jgi:putative membrane protein
MTRSRLLRTSLLLASVSLLLPGAVAGGNDMGAMTAGMSTAQTTSNTDVLFMETATMSNLAEITTSRQALQKSGNTAVRDFAQKMITDHTRAQDELGVLAASKGVRLTDKPGADQRLLGNKLATLSGAAFDAEYKKVQVAGHQMTLNLIRTYLTFGRDAQVLAYAAKIEPVVAMHLQMAQALP